MSVIPQDSSKSTATAVTAALSSKATNLGPIRKFGMGSLGLTSTDVLTNTEVDVANRNVNMSQKTVAGSVGFVESVSIKGGLKGVPDDDGLDEEDPKKVFKPGQPLPNGLIQQEYSGLAGCSAVGMVGFSSRQMSNVFGKRRNLGAAPDTLLSLPMQTTVEDELAPVVAMPTLAPSKGFRLFDADNRIKVAEILQDEKGNSILDKMTESVEHQSGSLPMNNLAAFNAIKTKMGMNPDAGVDDIARMGGGGEPPGSAGGRDYTLNILLGN
jgi:hypothetical protein